MKKWLVVNQKKHDKVDITKHSVMSDLTKPLITIQFASCKLMVEFYCNVIISNVFVN